MVHQAGGAELNDLSRNIVATLQTTDLELRITAKLFCELAHLPRIKLLVTPEHDAEQQPAIANSRRSQKQGVSFLRKAGEEV